MQYIAVMPHEGTPNPQLSLWTMYVNWEPRCFFRIIPGSSYDEVIRTFICHSNHWSDKLILLDNEREYTVEEVNALLQAPLMMQDKHKGLHIMGHEDNKTMIIRRDAFDLLEQAGVPDNWYRQKFNMVELIRRAEGRVALYEPEDEDGIQEQAQGRDGDSGSERPKSEGDTT